MTDAGAHRPSAPMRTSALGSAIARIYGLAPGRTRLLQAVVRLEGGEMFSTSLRRVLREHHGVEVGPYSYGSLCRPGMADRGTVIGPYVSVGPNVRRIGASHPLDEPSLHPFWYNPRFGFVDDSHDIDRTTCRIEADAWIGANSVILPGCRRIGVGAVVGAGSIVTADVNDFTVVAGNPAVVIRERLNEEQRTRLLTLRPWDRDPLGALAALRGLAGRDEVR